MSINPFPHKDLVSVADLSPDHIQCIFSTAAALKADRERYTDLLAGKRLAMVFEKESLRTRFTFEIGMQDLGGSAVFLDHTSARLGSRESVPDMARNLERWVHAIVARTYKHRAVTEMARCARIPVINGLSDFLHPCQALADLFTLWEIWGDVRGRRITFVGDGNNTCHSLMHAASILGAHITVCTPEGYEPNLKVMNECLAAAAQSGSEVTCCNDPVQAMQGAEAVYTDVWASMGQEDETEERSAIFAEYQVNETLLGHSEDALFMHCLPAHRGQEVSAAVIDSERSIVFDIAENRLHVQKSILVWLLAPHMAPNSPAAADSPQPQHA